MHLCTIVPVTWQWMHSAMHQCQMNSQYRLHLHSAPVEGRTGGLSDMDNPQVYIRHKDVRPSSHQKNHFFSTKKKAINKTKLKIAEKKKKKMLSSQFSNIRRTRFDQSSPVHPVSESRGGYPERDIRRTKDKGRRKSSCLILDIRMQDGSRGQAEGREQQTLLKYVHG